jgi:hypothetical protein
LQFPQLEKAAEREVGSGRVSGENKALRENAFVEKASVGGDGVVELRGKGVFGSEPVIESK